MGLVDAAWAHHQDEMLAALVAETAIAERGAATARRRMRGFASSRKLKVLERLVSCLFIIFGSTRPRLSPPDFLVTNRHKQSLTMKLRGPKIFSGGFKVKQ